MAWNRQQAVFTWICDDQSSLTDKCITRPQWVKLCGAHMVNWTRSWPCRWWLVACVEPIHYLNHSWIIVQWAHTNLMKFEQNANIFFLRKKKYLHFAEEWPFCSGLNLLTHWGQVTHICVGNLTIIASDNGLSPYRRQAIIWTNAGLLLIGPLGTNFSEILIEILTFSFKKMRLKVSSAKRRPLCLGLNVLHGDGARWKLVYWTSN